MIYLLVFASCRYSVLCVAVVSIYVPLLECHHDLFDANHCCQSLLCITVGVIDLLGRSFVCLVRRCLFDLRSIASSVTNNPDGTMHTICSVTTTHTAHVSHGRVGWKNYASPSLFSNPPTKHVASFFCLSPCCSGAGIVHCS